MNHSRYILITSFLVSALFFIITYTACTKDKCAGVSCMNGGICYSGECACVPGYEGKYCEEKSKSCEYTECKNGGKCLSGTCACPPEYYGTFCELLKPVDSCKYLKCANGAICKDNKCLCPEGYVGRLCDSQLRMRYVNKSYIGDGNDNKGHTYTDWSVYFAYSYYYGNVMDMKLQLRNASGGVIADVTATLTSDSTYVIHEQDTGTPLTTYNGYGSISKYEISLNLSITDAGGTTALSFEKMKR